MKPFGIEYLEPMSSVADINGALVCQKVITFIEGYDGIAYDMIC